MPTTHPLLSALFLTTFLVLCGPGRSLAQVPLALEGRWSGAAIENGTPTLFELEFELVDDSVHTTLTQPYSGYSRFPYPFRYEDGRLKSGLFGDEMDLIVDLRRGQLRGTVVNEGEITKTVFLQRVLDFPLPGYREEEVSYRAGSDTLAGSLLLPDGPGPYPAIVFVAGRGYGSRYGSIRPRKYARSFRNSRSCF